MSFFTDTSKVGGNPFEPKRKFRWILSFSSIGSDANFMAVSAAKPSVTMEATKHEFLNHEFKFPSKVKWQPITVKFIDSFQANMGSRFYNILRGSGYLQPEDMGSALGPGLTKANMAAAVGEITIRQLDGGDVESVMPDMMGYDPNPIFNAANIREEWRLVNGLITSIKWGDGLTYTEAGLVEVEVGLDYDFAYYSEGGGAGI